MLAMGAGLMVRSFAALLSVDLGFDPRRIVAFTAVPVQSAPEVQTQYFSTLLQQIRELPDIAAAGAVDYFALGDAQRAEQTFDECERLFVQNGRDAHGQRWYAAGLAGVARARGGDAEKGDAALDQALAKLSAEGTHASFEQMDLMLHAGAAARRRGDAETALTLHRRAADLQKQIGWLGEVGQAWTDAELSMDGQMADADAEAREHATERATRSREILQRVAPNDPRLAQLPASAPPA
jgi:tetratricopeptide (TPR) repeat protein